MLIACSRHLVIRKALEFRKERAERRTSPPAVLSEIFYSKLMQTQDITHKGKLPAGLTLTVPDADRVLIVSDNDSDTERLKTAFQDAGLTSENANSMTVGCQSAKSGRFQVIFSTPLLPDGSWGRLIDLANQYNLSFEIVLLARSFTFNEWAEALQVGAFDVLDVLSDLPKAAEVARRASGSAFLKRFRPHPEHV
jgi:CheY-like chemotaxis protein